MYSRCEADPDVRGGGGGGESCTADAKLVQM